MKRAFTAVVLAWVTLTLVACRGGGASPEPSPSPSAVPDDPQLFIFTYGPDLDEVAAVPNLMICEPVRFQGPGVDFDESFAIAPIGAQVVYRENTCLPDIEGERVAVRSRDGSKRYVPIEHSKGDLDQERIIWMPALFAEQDSGGPTHVGSARSLKDDAWYECTEIGCHVNVSIRDGERVAYLNWKQHMLGVPQATFISGVAIRDRNGQLSAPWYVVLDESASLSVPRLTEDDARMLVDLLNSGSLR